MGRLPGGHAAIPDLGKIEDYCLSPSHSRGRHKARVLKEAVEIGDALGSHWRLDAPVTRQGRTAVVGTVWIFREGQQAPRFVTCWVL